MSTEIQVWYLAHPVRGDGIYTQTENMAHVLKLIRTLYESNLYVIAPWFVDLAVFDDSDPEQRARGLMVDSYVAAKLGRIVLTGHRLSSGMETELRAVERVGGMVLDLIGIPDADIPSTIETHNKIFALANGG